MPETFTFSLNHGLIAGGAALALWIALLWLAWRGGRSRGFEQRGSEVATLAAERQALQRELDALQARLDEAEDEGRSLERQVETLVGQVNRQQGQMERMPSLEKSLAEAQARVESLGESLHASERQNAELATRLEAQGRAAEEKLALLRDAGEQLKSSFQALAHEILEDKSKRFTAQNAEQLGQLIKPLREDIGGFRQLVSESYRQEGQERAVLREQIEQLKGLNERLSTEASALAQALRGDMRTQGAWGEMILERVLEASGLERGREFEVQVSLKDDDGSRWRPDAIVRLPEERDLIIDAKVSLTAYVRAAEAADDAQRTVAIGEHVESVRAHIRGLGERDYTRLPEVRSPDFVLLFVPVEAALHDAIRADPGLQDFALRQRVALVGPSTLLVTLRTVSNLWRLETQNRNAHRIAERAGRLYDKFNGFIADLQKVGTALGTAQGAWDDAFGKLSQGRGNLLRQVERLRELGAPVKSRLPRALVEPEEVEDNGDDDAPQS
ncbi:MAG TPA: DNA recombination protein RmuC [Xanthomonadaceae bacterium]|nr:DNA recombination protein RmuC [Xanthomonadaceae bacterium]